MPYLQRDSSLGQCAPDRLGLSRLLAQLLAARRSTFPDMDAITARRFRCGERGLSVSRKQRNRSLERERLRRERLEVTAREREMPYDTRRSAAQRCGWCGGFIDVKAIGRIPKWCSATCRQRAWEQRRAAASGRCAVEVVERVVRVPVERERTPRHGDWLPLLHELATQLDCGRIYFRELPELGEALSSVVTAYRRRR